MNPVCVLIIALQWAQIYWAVIFQSNSFAKLVLQFVVLNENNVHIDARNWNKLLVPYLAIGPLQVYICLSKSRALSPLSTSSIFSKSQKVCEKLHKQFSNFCYFVCLRRAIYAQLGEKCRKILQSPVFIATSTFCSSETGSKTVLKCPIFSFCQTFDRYKRYSLIIMQLKFLFF